MSKERVIFRRERNREATKYEQDFFLACYPDEEANTGTILALPFHFTNDGLTVIECHDEISLDYYYQQKIIHKNDPIISKLIDAIERIYNHRTTFEAVEKITRRRSR